MSLDWKNGASSLDDRTALVEHLLLKVEASAYPSKTIYDVILEDLRCGYSIHGGSRNTVAQAKRAFGSKDLIAWLRATADALEKAQV